MSRRRAAPLSGLAVFAIVVAFAFVLIAAALVVLASTECSETETGCRHNEIDIN